MEREKDTSVLLDEKLLCFMDQLELLEEKRQTFNSLIEQGWLSMSQARFSMGNKRVSSLQYGRDMEPLVRVHARTGETGEAEFHTDRMTPAQQHSGPVEDIGPREEGVRRRRVVPEEAVREAEHPAVTTVTPPPDHSLQPDPLRWFGILVPQSLKQAQASFKQVIELSAEIAALQSAVLRSRQDLQLDLTEKHRTQNHPDPV